MKFIDRKIIEIMKKLCCTDIDELEKKLLALEKKEEVEND